jgi:general secretion pathway protein I
VRSRGFTLLEILVAVAVFAVVSAALIKNATQSVRQAGIIQERVYATLVAENEMNARRLEIRTDDNYPSAGTERTGVSMAGRNWDVVVVTDSTDNENVRRLTVQVFNEQNNTEPVIELDGFVGRF